MLKMLAIVLLPVAALCQSFENIDLGPTRSSDQRMSVGLLPDGHVACYNVTLRRLIVAAHDVDVSLVTGGPAWLDSERFDLVATTAPTSKTIF